MTRPLIGYVRVSTATQGKSGLGIEAQREALGRFAEAEGFELVNGGEQFLPLAFATSRRYKGA
jgi:DNA invertase Pin-like site-specific DNA recombinase